MNLCHLYNKITSSHHIQILLESFEDSESFEICKLDSLSTFDVYVIELDSADNEVSKKLIELFRDKKDALVYFIVSQHHNLILFQLTYKLNAKDIITNGQKTDKVIKKITNDFEVKKPLEVISTCRDDYIVSRVDFLNLLKDELSYRDVNNSQLNAITVSFQNMKELQKDLTILELEEHTNNTLEFMYDMFEDELKFVQLHNDYYIIIFKNLDFEELKELAQDFHNAVLENMTHDKYKFFIDIFSINMNDLGLSEVLSTLNNIKLRNLSHKQSTSTYIQHTSKAQNIISEEDVLNDAFVNKTTIKLLNIYNGLVISTPSRIIKQTEDSIYVSFEQLQGVVMNLEKETILQSSVFLQDILASIRVISLKKKVAVLEKFKFLNTNVNARKYARVTTASKMPIVINIDKSTINGNVLDISIKSIAISTKFTQRVADMKDRDVNLTFNIPNYRFDDGYVQLHVEAKVMVIIDTKDDSCKVVCDLVEGSDGESIIKEYVYDRQKELIIEVKKMSLLN